MKNWIRALMIPAATMSFGLVACGDDDPATDTTPTDTTVTETAAETTATETTTTTAETTVEEVAAETAEEVVAGNACTNAADLAVIGHKDADGKADTDPAAKASYCGTSATCLPLVFTDLNAFEACVSGCMLDIDAAAPPEDTINTPEKWRFAVSGDCTDCYVASVRCTGEFCAGKCAADPSSTACVDCRATNGCTSGFFTCSGLTPPAN